MKKIKRSIVVFLFKAYARARPYVSPIVWRVFYKGHFKNAPAIEYDFNPYGLDVLEFERLLAGIPYKWDMLKGLIDATIPPKYTDWFFKQVKKGRDCDDFVRVWSKWAEFNGYICREWFSIDPEHPFKTAHVICTLQNEKEVRLCSLSYVSIPWTSVEEAINHYKGWFDGERVIVEYNWHKEW